METLDEEVSVSELIELCAVDSALYASTFFPRTARQRSPKFHAEMDVVLEDPKNRFVAFKVFRGGAKTSKFRLFMSKRIAYGISHTIVIIGKSQDHAIKSVEWLMTQIEYNKRWADTFQLRRGKKWTSNEVEIIHGTDDYPIRVMALGITGSIRGINVDDYRPDLILLDDPCDEENTATFEQRDKISKLVFGALAKTLAPESEAPDATMALAQTPLDSDDLIENAMKDKQWASVKISCFNEAMKSVWEERWTTEVLLADKQAHIDRNQLSLWLREMECEVVTEESAAFRLEWLKYWEVLPEGGITYLSIDPTPPPKDGNALKQINKKLDNAVIMAIKLYNGKVYLVDYYLTKSPNPEEFVNKFFEMAMEHRPMLTGVETTLFQRMLKWYIDKEMQRRQQFFTIMPIEDKRKKETRIIQGISRYASNGNLLVNKKLHPEFIEEYSKLQSGVTGQRDDMLDALTIGLDLINPALEGVVMEGDYTVVEDESNIPDQLDWRTAP